MAHRVLTVTSINELLSQGCTELKLEPGDIVTALAKEHAQQRGLRLVPANGGLALPAPAPQASAGKDTDRAAVRKAVIAAVGHEPNGLDAIINRIMG